MDDLSLAYNAYLSLIFTYLTLIVRLRLYSFRGNYPLFELRSSPVLHGRRGSRSGPLCGVFIPPIMPFWKESVLFLSFLWHFIINARFQSTILCLFFPSSHTSPSGLWPFHYHRGQYINNILCTHKRFYVIERFLNCWTLYWFKPYI